MDKINIQIKALSDHCTIPTYESSQSSGMDIYADFQENKIITSGKYLLVPTGFSVKIPAGYEIQIRPRSGLAMKHGITVLNSPGTIDSDYRGEIKVILINLGQEDFVIQPKMRIAQMVVQRVFHATLEIVAELDSSSRGSGGFGSTGL